MSLRGYVDQVTHYTVTGWAFDEDAPEITIHVIISVDGLAVGGAPANRFREDLTNLYSGSTGKHGFQFSFDPSLSPFKENAVEVTFEQIAQLLPNGKKSLRRLVSISPRSQSPVPILITAMGRSGTSLLMNRLASCEDIVVAGEFPFEIKMLSYYSLALRTLVSEGERDRSTDPDKMASESERFGIGFNPFNHPDFMSVLGDQALHSDFFLGRVPTIIGEAFRDIILGYYDLVRIRTRKPRMRYIAEKILPDLTSRLVPRFLFGSVKEIVLIRDPRDLLCSFDSYWKFSGDQAIDSIASTMRAMAAIRQENRDDAIFVKFEDLVLRQPDTLQSVASFLGVDDKLDSDVSDDANRFKSHGTSQTPEASIGRWKRDLPQEQLEKCLPRFSKYLALFAYEL
jgi:Sulfotransferase family